MTFKKTIIVLATVGLIAFFIMETTDKTGGDESTVPREMESAENVTDSSHSPDAAQFIMEFETIDDYVLHSDVIVTGRVVDVSYMDNGFDEAVVEVKDQLRGHSDTHINLYTVNGVLSEGQERLMFLSRNVSNLYPAPLHALVGEGHFFITEDNKVTHNNPQLENDLPLPELMKEIAQSEFIDAPHPLRERPSENRTNSTVKNPTIDYLMAQSDFVVYLQVDNISENHKYFNVLDANILNQINLTDDVTFEFEKKTILELPAYVKEGENYLVFYQLVEGHYDMTTREGSVISEQEVAFGEAAKELNINK